MATVEKDTINNGLHTDLAQVIVVGGRVVGVGCGRGGSVCGGGTRASRNVRVELVLASLVLGVRVVQEAQLAEQLGLLAAALVLDEVVAQDLLDLLDAELLDVALGREVRNGSAPLSRRRWRSGSGRGRVRRGRICRCRCGRSFRNEAV